MGTDLSRRQFLARGTTAVAATSAVAGTASALTTPSDATDVRATVSAENGKLKFANETGDAICSLELENVLTGTTIEILDLPLTHDILKPDYTYTYASADYPEIQDDVPYNVTATICDGAESATIYDFFFSRGAVWTLYQW